MAAEKNRNPIVIPLAGAKRTHATLYPIQCDAFDRIFDAGRGYMYVSLRGAGVGLINWRGEVILEPRWDQVSPYFEEGVIIASKGKTRVLLDFEGKTLTGQLMKELLDGRPGATVLDKNGKLTHVDEIGDFCDGMARVSISGRIGYVDAKGCLAVEMPGMGYGNFHDHRALFVQKNGFFKPKTYGYINRLGREIIKPVYSDAGEFSEGFAPVTAGGKRGYINKMGKMLECYSVDGEKRIPLPALNGTEPFCNGYARVMTLGGMVLIPGGDGIWQPLLKGDGGWGMISREGRLTVEMKYNWLSDVNENGICVCSMDAGTYGLLHAEGKQLMPCVFTNIAEQRGGLFALEANGRWMVADRDGRLIGERRWEKIGRLAADGVCVLREGLWGVIGFDGETIMSFISEMDFCLKDGAALVKKNGEYLLCGKGGQALAAERFDDAINLLPGLTLIKWKDTMYLLDYGFEEANA